MGAPGRIGCPLPGGGGRKADGSYHYIDTPAEARRVFVDNLNSLLASVARDAKIQVEFDHDMVTSYRLPAIGPSQG